MRYRYGLILFLVLILPDWVLAGGEGGQAGAFLRVGLGPRAKGMGDAFVAIAEGPTAAYYNPSGLAFTETRHVMASYSHLTFDRQFNYIGYSQKLPPRAGIAVGLIQTGFSDNVERGSNGQEGDTFTDSQLALVLGFGVKPGEKFAFGIAPKFIYNKIYTESSTAFGLDLGVMLAPIDNLRLGASVSNLKTRFKFKTTSDGFDFEKEDTFPVVTRLGVSYISVPDRYKTLVAFDVELNSSQTPRYHVGAESYLHPNLTIRAGFDHTDVTAGFTVPFEVTERRFQMDYAFIRDARGGIGFGTHDFSFSFLF